MKDASTVEQRTTGEEIQLVPNVTGASEEERVSARAVVEDHLLRVQLVPQTVVVFGLATNTM